MLRSSLVVFASLVFGLVGCSSTTAPPPVTGTGSGYIYHSSGGSLSRTNATTGTTALLMSTANQADVQPNGNLLVIEQQTGRMVESDLTGANRREILKNDYTKEHLSYFNDARISPNGKYIAYDGSTYHEKTFIVDAITGEYLFVSATMQTRTMRHHGHPPANLSYKENPHEIMVSTS